MKVRALLTCSALLLSITRAEAHVELLDPMPRYSVTELKDAPCGRRGGVRTTDRITTFAPGSTITVRFSEYIDHPGHYRIAFDVDGDDDFTDPICINNCDNADMEIAIGSEPWILLDGIEDRRGGGVYEVQVTLPNVTCERCTLQVIQVMTDKAPYELPGNDLYYQCADIVLRQQDGTEDGGLNDASDLGPDAPTDGDTSPDGGPTDGGGPTDRDIVIAPNITSSCRTTSGSGALIYLGFMGLATWFYRRRLWSL